MPGAVLRAELSPLHYVHYLCPGAQLGHLPWQGRGSVGAGEVVRTGMLVKAGHLQSPQHIIRVSSAFLQLLWPAPAGEAWGSVRPGPQEKQPGTDAQSSDTRAKSEK